MAFTWLAFALAILLVALAYMYVWFRVSGDWMADDTMVSVRADGTQVSRRWWRRCVFGQPFLVSWRRHLTMEIAREAGVQMPRADVFGGQPPPYAQQGDGAAAGQRGGWHLVQVEEVDEDEDVG